MLYCFVLCSVLCRMPCAAAMLAVQGSQWHRGEGGGLAAWPGLWLVIVNGEGAATHCSCPH